MSSEKAVPATPVQNHCSTGFPVDDCSGEMVSIYRHELALLRKVAESSSDFVMGTLDSEFASRNGGKDSLFDIMVAQIHRHAEWLSDFDGP